MATSEKQFRPILVKIGSTLTLGRTLFFCVPTPKCFFHSWVNFASAFTKAGQKSWELSGNLEKPLKPKNLSHNNVKKERHLVRNQSREIKARRAGTDTRFRGKWNQGKLGRRILDKKQIKMLELFNLLFFTRKSRQSWLIAHMPHGKKVIFIISST